MSESLLGEPRLAMTPVGEPFTTPLSHAAWSVAASPALALALKRGVDIGFSLILLIVLALPMLLVAMLIRYESDGPALFRQTRIGHNGVPFTIWKFRTMRDQAAPAGRLCQARRRDLRVTCIGGWLRRSSLDELPQLLNVLRGDMSLVGPRPHAPGTRAAGVPFEHVTPHYARRHAVRPGMTGLAQVRGWRGETDTVEKLLHRVDSDLEYIATWSLGLDLLILLRTVGTILEGRNAY